MEHTELNVAHNINGTDAKGLIIIEGDQNPVIIAMLTSTIKSAEVAARIVKAWNMHNELVAAIKKCHDEFMDQASEGRYPSRFMAENGGEGLQFLSNLINKAEKISPTPNH